MDGYPYTARARKVDKCSEQTREQTNANAKAPAIHLKSSGKSK